MAKRINTRDLVNQIEKLTKTRIASQPVVELDQFRDAKKKMQPPTLLIIEDDPSMRAALQRIFEPEGYKVKVAADASELGKVMGEDPIDLILLDIGLPWVNGFELGRDAEGA